MTGMTTYRDESGPDDTTAWNYDPVTGLLVQKLYADVPRRSGEAAEEILGTDPKIELAAGWWVW